MKNVLLFVMAAPVVLFSCRAGKLADAGAAGVRTMEKRVFTAKANLRTTVYRTVDDYSNYVPVIMNDSRTRIVAYPDPSDLGEGSRPIRLKGGYLLDNRGINENVVFLTYTYEEYANLPGPPSVDEMMGRVLERYPLIELIDCGDRAGYGGDLAEELNALVDADFPGCGRWVQRRD
jgi:hypothetical protein